jgi:hypothetical protein
MKKTGNQKNSPAKKSTEKGKEAGDLKKTPKLKPLKEKEKKSWKNSLNVDDEDDFGFDEDLKLDSDFDEEDEEEDFFDEDKY